MLEQYLDWFEHLKLYQEYLSKLPEPFNHSILLSILFLCLMFTLVSTIVNHILSWRFYRRIKAKNRKLEEEKIDRKLQEAEEEKWKKSENELFRNYIKFVMMAQIQNMDSLKNITFEQWQSARSRTSKTVEVVRPISTKEKDSLTKKEKSNDTSTELEDTIKKETPYTMQQKQVVPEQEVSTKECLSTEGNHTTLSEDKKETTKTELKEELSLEKQHELQLQIDILKLEEEELDFEEISEDILTLLPAEMIHEEEKTCEPKEEQLQELSDCIPKEPIQEELTEEQLSDFSKLIALMQAENRQKEQVEEYNKKKTAITKQNIEVLEKSFHKEIEQLEHETKETSVSEDEVERRKKQALAIMEEEQLNKKKKGFFKKRKL